MANKKGSALDVETCRRVLNSDSRAFTAGHLLAWLTIRVPDACQPCSEGWATWIVIVIAGSVLFLVNTKLMWVARYATRGGDVHRLKPGVFWLHRPWLFLPVIKSLLFFVSFVFANSAFFAWQFGPSSCYFSRSGFQGHPVPWWVSHPP